MRRFRGDDKRLLASTASVAEAEALLELLRKRQGKDPRGAANTLIMALAVLMLDSLEADELLGFCRSAPETLRGAVEAVLDAREGRPRH